MTNDLYFIPILARALEQSNTRVALPQAFAEIERLGCEPGYERGLTQFHRFMAAAQQGSQSARVPEIGMVRELIVELVSGAFDGNEEERQAVLDLIRSRPAWQDEHARMCTELAPTSTAAQVTNILVSRQDQVIGTITVGGEPHSGSIGNVTPGDYTVALETGRVIWEGKLTTSDCIWTAAFPGAPVALAADTEHAERRTTREIPLLEGELTLCVYPGIEAGRLELTWRNPRAAQR